MSLINPECPFCGGPWKSMKKLRNPYILTWKELEGYEEKSHRTFIDVPEGAEPEEFAEEFLRDCCKRDFLNLSIEKLNQKF